MIPVHNHSQWSTLDGYATEDELVARIQELGLPGCFITDHGTVAGFPYLRKAFKKADLWLGFGMEGYQARTSRLNRPKERNARDHFHTIILAENDVGYANLFKLSDESNRSGFFHRPRFDWELLKQYSEGLIATSACMAGLVPKGVRDDDTEALNHYLNIFGENFYIELHTYDTPRQQEMNLELASIAARRGLPVIYANDAHYAFPEQYDMHETLLCMQYQEAIYDEKRQYDSHPTDDPTRYHPHCLYIMDEEEVRHRLDYLPSQTVDEAISNTDDLFERCQVGEREFQVYLPKYGRNEVDTNAQFIDAVEDGLLRLYGEDAPDEVWERAEYELESIMDAGFADYFLIMADAMEFCKRNGIMIGPGRGSVGGSIIAYCMGITALCPLKYGLYFERFWNPGRTKGLPDIDVDIEVAHRDDVKKYLIEKYGEKRVLSVGNHMTIKPKGSILAAGRALYGSEAPYGDLKSINKIIESLAQAGKQPSWAKVNADPEASEALAPYREKYPDLFAIAEELEGRLDKYAIHASAVVISSVDLPEHLPARMSSDDELGQKNKTLVTQVEMRAVEAAGFPKFDFLGLRNLDLVMQAAILSGEFGEDSLETRRKIIDYFWSLDGNLVREGFFDNAPLSLWEQYDHGHTLGIFQVEEGGGAKRIAKEMKPRSISDLGLVVALNRPGPDSDAYLAKRAGEEEVHYAHPMMEEIRSLAETLGEFVYQEAIIEFCKAIGFSLSDADHVRKVVGKKLDKEMALIEPEFMEKAQQHMSKAAAENVWRDIVVFADYGFNKAHSIGYGTISGWTAHVKDWIPAPTVMAAINTIRTGQKKIEKIGSWLADAKRMGVEVLPPDVNHSGVETGLVDGNIYFGLADVKGVGKDASLWIIENRPYESYEDFIEILEAASDEWKNADKRKRAARSPKQTVPSKMVNALRDAGAFDGLGYERGTLHQRAKLEKELLGFAITNPHLDAIEANWDQIEGLPTYEAIDELTTGTIKVPGVVAAANKTFVRSGKNKGKEMGHATIEWNGETYSFAVFSDKWEQFKGQALKTGNLGIFTLGVDKKGANLRSMRKLV